MDVQFGACHLRVTWKSSNEEIEELDYALKIEGISVSHVKINIDDQQFEEGILVSKLICCKVIHPYES